MLAHDGHGFEVAHGTQLPHHGIGFFDGAEVACTAKPAGRVKGSIDRQVGEKLLDADANGMSRILRRARVVAGIHLYAIARLLDDTASVGTCRDGVRAYQRRNACILMDGDTALSGHVLLQAREDVRALGRGDVYAQEAGGEEDE